MLSLYSVTARGSLEFVNLLHVTKSLADFLY